MGPTAMLLVEESQKSMDVGRNSLSWQRKLGGLMFSAIGHHCVIGF